MKIFYFIISIIFIFQISIICGTNEYTGLTIEIKNDKDSLLTIILNKDILRFETEIHYIKLTNSKALEIQNLKIPHNSHFILYLNKKLLLNIPIIDIYKSDITCDCICLNDDSSIIRNNNFIQITLYKKSNIEFDILYHDLNNYIINHTNCKRLRYKRFNDFKFEIKNKKDSIVLIFFTDQIEYYEIGNQHIKLTKEATDMLNNNKVNIEYGKLTLKLKSIEMFNIELIPLRISLLRMKPYLDCEGSKIIFSRNSLFIEYKNPEKFKNFDKATYENYKRNYEGMFSKELEEYIKGHINCY
jgi:hypothetical protein